jgi:hypothetical protein
MNLDWLVVALFCELIDEIGHKAPTIFISLRETCSQIQIWDVYPFEYPMPTIELESLEMKSACLLGFVGAMLKAGSDNSKLSNALKVS